MELVLTKGQGLDRVHSREAVGLQLQQEAIWGWKARKVQTLTQPNGPLTAATANPTGQQPLAQALLQRPEEATGTVGLQRPSHVKNSMVSERGFKLGPGRSNILNKPFITHKKGSNQKQLKYCSLPVGRTRAQLLKIKNKAFPIYNSV